MTEAFIIDAAERVLMAETGWFASLWSKLAGRLGLQVEIVPGGRFCMSWERASEIAEHARGFLK